MIKPILNTKTIQYSSDVKETLLKQKIEDLFTQGNLTFVGKFTGETTFETYNTSLFKTQKNNIKVL